MEYKTVEVEADGMPYHEVGLWTEEKHRLVSMYAAQFSGAMKEKCHKRVYVELYAGAGYSRIRETDRVIPGSPIRALTLKEPFDKYIFCEENPSKIEKLYKIRVKRHAPANADVIIVPGDCDIHSAQNRSSYPPRIPRITQC